MYRKLKEELLKSKYNQIENKSTINLMKSVVNEKNNSKRLNRQREILIETLNNTSKDDFCVIFDRKCILNSLKGQYPTILSGFRYELNDLLRNFQNDNKEFYYNYNKQTNYKTFTDFSNNNNEVELIRKTLLKLYPRVFIFENNELFMIEGNEDSKTVFNPIPLLEQQSEVYYFDLIDTLDQFNIDIVEGERIFLNEGYSIFTKVGGNIKTNLSELLFSRTNWGIKKTFYYILDLENGIVKCLGSSNETETMKEVTYYLDRLLSTQNYKTSIIKRKIN